MPEAKTAMISCKECAAPNSLDSAFCKKCGKPLAQEEAIDARETVEKQLDHGFELFHHGRTDEAWLNVESCLIADPDNLRALSLKGLILERRGLVHEALECFEKIVSKDPNAALERMKLQTLRGTLDLRNNERPPQQQRLALGIAVCVTLLVISVVGAFAFSRRSQPQVVANTTGEKPNYTVDSFNQNDRSQAIKQAAQSQATADQSKTDNTQEAAKSDSQPATTQTQKITPTPLNGALPNPAQTDENTSKPVNPLAGAQISPIPSTTNDQTVQSATNNANIGAPSGSRSADPDPSAVQQTAQQTKPSRPPVVDIKLSDDQPPKDSDLAIDANGIEAMLRAARSQYQIGNYQSAASTYERALTAGADPAMTNQRLAQCYEQLGRTSEAKAAYGRAINAIQTQINGGKGNKDRLLAALNSSQQALKNLQGG